MRLKESLSSGKALEVFGKMIAAMGGNNNFIERPDDCLPVAENILIFHHLVLVI